MAFSAGEMISDSKDLGRFYRALLTGRLLPKEQLDEMTDTVAVDDTHGYGLGLMSTELSCGVTVWGHGGASSTAPRPTPSPPGTGATPWRSTSTATGPGTPRR